MMMMMSVDGDVYLTMKYKKVDCTSEVTSVGLLRKANVTFQIMKVYNKSGTSM